MIYLVAWFLTFSFVRWGITANLPFDVSGYFLWASGRTEDVAEGI
jgi:hypothetical protein